MKANEFYKEYFGAEKLPLNPHNAIKFAEAYANSQRGDGETKAIQQQNDDPYHVCCQNCGTTSKPLQMIPFRNDNHVVGLLLSCDKCKGELYGQRFDREIKFSPQSGTKGAEGDKLIDYDEEAHKCLHEMGLLDQFIKAYHPDSNLLIKYKLSEAMVEFGKWLQGICPSKAQVQRPSEPLTGGISEGLTGGMSEGMLREFAIRFYRIGASDEANSKYDPFHPEESFKRYENTFKIALKSLHLPSEGEIATMAKEVIPEDLYNDASGYPSIEDRNYEKRKLWIAGAKAITNLIKGEK